jgi:hypothetical protein
MITLYSREIIAIVKKQMPIGMTLHGAEDLREWILTNRFDNHSWIRIEACHRAMQLMVASGLLIKEKKKCFTRNPLY